MWVGPRLHVGQSDAMEKRAILAFVNCMCQTTNYQLRHFCIVSILLSSAAEGCGGHEPVSLITASFAMLTEKKLPNCVRAHAYCEPRSLYIRTHTRPSTGRLCVHHSCDSATIGYNLTRCSIRV